MKGRIVSSGMDKLDAALGGGLQRGEMIIIASAPGTGKTSFALQIAGNAAKRGSVVLYFSLESAKEKIENLAEVQGSRSKTLIVDDSANVTPEHIRDKLENAKNVDLIVVDYIQLMCGDEGAESRDLSRHLKQLAKEKQIPIICCSQISSRALRMNGSRYRRPDITDLRNIGSLEKDSDAVIFLHKEKNDDNSVEVIVAKNRWGSLGTIEVVFDPEKRLFTEKSFKETLF